MRTAAITIAVLTLLAVGYLLSYAPVYRFAYPTNYPHFDNGRWEVLYAPVHWLIDYSPCREPLLRWADLWGVGDAMKMGSQNRMVWAELTEPHS